MSIEYSDGKPEIRAGSLRCVALVQVADSSVGIGVTLRTSWCGTTVCAINHRRVHEEQSG